VSQPQVVHEWRKKYPDFPAPVATLNTALIWDYREVERWAGTPGAKDLQIRNQFKVGL